MANIFEIAWKDFCTKYNINTETIEKWFNLIKNSHNERSYYDFKYLENKLQNFEICRHKLKEPDAVFLALIFQSIYYKTNSAENPEKCKEKFNEFVSETKLGDDEKNKNLVEKIHELIEISVTNSSDEFWEEGKYGTEDMHYFLDINFVHLAQDWDEYNQFSIKTRNEYNFLSDENYKQLRKKVLQSFLHIPNIYATSEFRNQYEEKARANIQREINALN